MISIYLIYKKTALHLAVENENIQIIQLLLKHPNIDIDIKDDVLFDYN